jgi:phage gp36-like protein
MTQYATIADLELAYGAAVVLKLSDRDGARVRNDAALNSVLARATSLANSYIDKKYAVPLASPPDFLVSAVIDVAVYMQSRDRTTGTEEMRKRYEDALKLFEKVAKGEVTLAGNEPASNPDTGMDGASGSNDVFVISRERHFTRRTEIL